jgi:CubicO group peptidase (beta-lactamase class C family)
VEGDMEPTDMMGLGSGTKGYTGAAIMRLVDQGKVKLEDPAYMHIDPIMTRDINQTMESLFGENAAKVTVKDLIFMKSGL